MRLRDLKDNETFSSKIGRKKKRAKLVPNPLFKKEPNKESTQRNQRTNWSDDMREDIVKRHLLGESLKDIADDYNISTTSISESKKREWFKSIRNQIVVIGFKGFQEEKRIKQENERDIQEK